MDVTRLLLHITRDRRRHTDHHRPCLHLPAGTDADAARSCLPLVQHDSRVHRRFVGAQVERPGDRQVGVDLDAAAGLHRQVYPRAEDGHRRGEPHVVVGLQRDIAGGRAQRACLQRQVGIGLDAESAAASERVTAARGDDDVARIQQPPPGCAGRGSCIHPRRRPNAQTGAARGLDPAAVAASLAAAGADAAVKACGAVGPQHHLAARAGARRVGAHLGAGLHAHVARVRGVTEGLGHGPTGSALPVAPHPHAAAAGRTRGLDGQAGREHDLGRQHLDVAAAALRGRCRLVARWW